MATNSGFTICPETNATNRALSPLCDGKLMRLFLPNIQPWKIFVVKIGHPSDILIMLSLIHTTVCFLRKGQIS
jgi:hypothetical protein